MPLWRVRNTSSWLTNWWAKPTWRSSNNIREFDVDFYCCVDSSVNVQQQAIFRQYKADAKGTDRVWCTGWSLWMSFTTRSSRTGSKPSRYACAFASRY
ncbi:hypothetical protein O9992_23370 [Vibrio lentus]|nr:hypothetical protein [Vibrio lentus]